MVGGPLSCVYAEIVLKFCLKNRIYVGRLFSKFGKDLIRGCGEIGISLTLHAYLQFFFVFLPILKVQGVIAHTLLKISTIHLVFLRNYYQNVPVSVEK